MSRFSRLQTLTEIRKPFGVTIHIGTKATNANGKEYPKSNDFFSFDGAFAERCVRIYGKTPRTLHLCFPKSTPEECCLLTQEGRNSSGVLISRATIAWWKEGRPETYETFDYRSQQWLTVTEDELTAFEQRNGITPAYNLRLSFWLRELMAEGVDCLCQLNTKADDSSIPAIVNVLTEMDALGRLQMYPYELSVAFNEGKGVNKDGEIKGKKYPVLSLHMDGSETALQAQSDAVDKYLHIRQMLPISKGAIQAIRGEATPQNALPAAPQIDSEQAIDSEIITPDAPQKQPAPVLDALTAEGDAIVAAWQPPLTADQQKAQAFWTDHRLRLTPDVKQKAVTRMRELTPAAPAPEFNPYPDEAVDVDNTIPAPEDNTPSGEREPGQEG